MHLGYAWFITHTNQCFFCEQQAITSDYIPIPKYPLPLTMHFFDFFTKNDKYVYTYQYCG